MATYVIAGATGRVGSTVASALLERGEAVTVIVRDEASGLDWTRRGAAPARDNVANLLPVAIHTGIYPNFFGSADAPIPMIATEDLGRFAAQALLSPPAAQEIVDVFGPLYSIRQVAQALTVVLGRDVAVFNIPPERHRDSLTEAGLARPVADTVAELFAAFNAGLIQPRGDRRVTGTIGILEVIRRYAERSGMAAPATS